MVVALIGRALAWVLHVVANPPLPRRFGVHLRRFALLLISLTALLLLPLHLSPHAARVVAAVLVGLVLVVALVAATGFQRLLDRFVSGDDIVLRGGRTRIAVPTLGRQVRTFEGLAAVLRRTGLSLPALLFFCGWALIYMLIWAHSPESCPADPAQPCAGAFQGLSANPTFGDFLYFAVNMAFANPVPDIIGRSRLAHTAATIEVLSGIGLVTLYAGSFFGIGRRGDMVSDEGGEPVSG